ncbi:hypothetical protein LEMLEM_LOCUS4604, partial [Lemmus lemmus]
MRRSLLLERNVFCLMKSKQNSEIDSEGMLHLDLKQRIHTQCSIRHIRNWRLWRKRWGRCKTVHSSLRWHFQ